MSDQKLSWIQNELDNLKAMGLFNTIRTIESPMDAWVTIDGRRLLNFCANNYLGLANNPRVREATKEAVDKYGVGPGAVRTIAGTMSLHIALEQRLAEFKTGGSMYYVPKWFYGQSGYDSSDCRPW